MEGSDETKFVSLVRIAGNGIYVDDSRRRTLQWPPLAQSPPCMILRLKRGQRKQAWAGGSATSFNKWPAQLPENVELRALQLPGRMRFVASHRINGVRSFSWGSMSALRIKRSDDHAAHQSFGQRRRAL